VTVDQIDVVVHPEAIVHSMVGFCDGSVIAQLGITDMRLPIQYALTYPDRWDGAWPEMDITTIGKLTFTRPDFKKFPALGLAIEAARTGGTLPSVLNASDEEAVAAFLNGRLSFSSIFTVVEKVVRDHRVVACPKLRDILAADGWARERTRDVMSRIPF